MSMTDLIQFMREARAGNVDRATAWMLLGIGLGAACAGLAMLVRAIGGLVR